jgi:hypothetical protein
LGAGQSATDSGGAVVRWRISSRVSRMRRSFLMSGVSSSTRACRMRRRSSSSGPSTRILPISHTELVGARNSFTSDDASPFHFGPTIM